MGESKEDQLDDLEKGWAELDMAFELTDSAFQYIGQTIGNLSITRSLSDHEYEEHLLSQLRSAKGSLDIAGQGLRQHIDRLREQPEVVSIEDLAEVDYKDRTYKLQKHDDTYVINDLVVGISSNAATILLKAFQNPGIVFGRDEMLDWYPNDNDIPVVGLRGRLYRNINELEGLFREAGLRDLLYTRRYGGEPIRLAIAYEEPKLPQPAVPAPATPPEQPDNTPVKGRISSTPAKQEMSASKPIPKPKKQPRDVPAKQPPSQQSSAVFAPADLKKRSIESRPLPETSEKGNEIRFVDEGYQIVISTDSGEVTINLGLELDYAIAKKLSEGKHTVDSLQASSFNLPRKPKSDDVEKAISRLRQKLRDVRKVNDNFFHIESASDGFYSWIYIA